ncbi:hypothetical protein BJ322DRAFT_1106917 [Thelephora terrestris]|uniref:Uncharacterized protein n=1 Tax=Thelephora terrestris TaxID=56493 RepID=A0A9P6HH40_9AGAM|nr:hypothetical protein BJ322DRAFT_1106917 [Thelephora terrestris]
MFPIVLNDYNPPLFSLASSHLNLNPDVEKWLGNHHRVSDLKDGDGIHVFAIEHGNVYSAEAKKTYEVVFSIGPVNIRIVIVLDLAQKTFSVCAFGKIPFLSEFRLGCGSGSFDKGVTLKFDLKIISGTFTFTIKDKWLWLHYDVSVMGKHWKGDLKLIPIP